MTTFNATGSIQTFTATAAGTYHIAVSGAQGGTASYNYSGGGQVNNAGGFGAMVSGDIVLAAGAKLEIVVGTQGGGNYQSAGGGGGSFVIETFDGTNAVNIDEIIAGGGGGGGSGDVFSDTTAPGGAAVTTPTGANGGNGGGAGGQPGMAGQSGGQSGGGGGGFTGGAGSINGSAAGSGDTAGTSFAGGRNAGTFAPYAVGGYGGGGAGGAEGGGGGGGYGGGGGGGTRGVNNGGGGGGSYYNATYVTNSSSAVLTHGGAGSVTITPPPPAAPTGLTQKAGTTTTSRGTVEITGTTTDAVGDTVNLYADNDTTTVVGTGTVQAGGTFDIVTTATFLDGNHTFTATDTSSNGATSAQSTSVTAVVNPSAPTALTQKAGTTTTSRGTVEITGTTTDAVGDTVNLYADGDTTTVVGTGTVQTGGTFDIVTSATFLDGNHTFTATDTNTAIGQTSAQSTSVTAVVNPATPTNLVQKTGTTTTSRGTVEITGTTTDAVGDTVNLYADGNTATVVGTGTVQTGGTFDIVTSATFLDGNHTFTATDTSANGTTSAQSASVTAVVNPSAPTALTQKAGTTTTSRGTVEITGTTTDAPGDTVNLYADGDTTTVVGTGTVQANGTFDIVTSATFLDGNHVFTATDTNTATGQTSAQSTSVIAVVNPSAPTGLAQVGTTTTSRGTVEITGTTTDAVGDTVNLYADNDTTTVVGTGTVQANGTFDITTTATFLDGNHTFTATDTSANGTTSARSTSVTAVVNPATPMNLAQKAGTTTTSRGTVEIIGTTTDAPGDTVNLYADGDTTTVVGTGTVQANGTFDIVTSATFLDGNHTFTATDTSANGTTSARSTSVTAVVNPSAPTALTQKAGTTTTSRGTVEITGTTTDAPGDTVNLYADGNTTTVVGTGTVQANGTFDIVTSATFLDGNHTFTATDTSANGTTSVQSAALTAVVNPAVPTNLAQKAGTTSTSRGTVEITGTTTDAPGDTVNLYADGNTTTVVGTGTVQANGTFDIVTSATFADGNHTFTATDTSANGTTSARSAPATAVVNPAVPTNLAQKPNTTTTSLGTVEITGTTTNAQNDTIDLYDAAGNVVGSGRVQANGTFDVITSQTFTDGSYTFTATDTSANGTTSAHSTAVTAVVNPSTPTGLAQKPGTTTTSRGTVEITGTTTDAPGDTVNLYADGNTTTVVGTGLVQANGTFDITTTATFLDGNHTFTATDTSSNGTTTAQSVAVTAVVNPSAPTALTQKAGTTTTSRGTVEITGTTTDAPGDTINLYADGNTTTVVGTGTVQANGTFDIVTSATFLDGNHTFTATDTSANGTTSARSTSVTAVVNPSAPMNLAQAGTTTTSRGTVEITGTTTDAPGDTVNLYADGNTTTVVGTGTVQANGTFDITTTATFLDGNHTFTATDTSSNGTTSAQSAAVTAVVNPSAPTNLVQKAGTTTTSRGTVEITGTTTDAVGDTVNLYADGNTTTVVGTGLVQANGTFDITTSATFLDGNHTFTATDTSANGTTSAQSTSVTAVVNPSTPTGLAQKPNTTTTSRGTVEITGTTTDAPGDTVNLYADGNTTTVVGTGTVQANGTFDITTSATFLDGNHTFTATDTNTAIGQTSAQSTSVIAVVNPATPTGLAQKPNTTTTSRGTVEITGTTTDAVGDTVNLYADGNTTTVVGTGTVQANGTFDIVTSATFLDGSHTFTATDTSANGTTSAQSTSVTAVVNPSAPTNLAQAGTTTTSRGTVEITGTTTDAPGDTVNLYADGDTTTVVGTGTVQANGTFDIVTSATFLDGNHVFTATDTNTATGQTSAQSTSVTAVVNPATPTGLAQVGTTTTSRGTVEITGTTTDAPGDTVNLYADGDTTTVVGTGTVQANGTFDITTSATFLDGNHTFTATDTSANGTTSAQSTSVTAVVNPSMPTNLVQKPNTTTTSRGTVEITGTTTDAPGDTVNLYADGDTTTVVGTGTVDATGAFDITTTATFTDGNHTFTATDTSAAGTTSAQSAAVTAVVDPAVPTALAQKGTATNGGTVEITGTTTDAPGDTVNLYADGNTTTVVGTGTVQAGGTFDIVTTATFLDGNHTFTATDTSANGTTSAQSASVQAVVHPNPPTVNQTAESANKTPTISGTGEVGASINLVVDNVAVTQAIAVDANGNWFYTPTAPLPDGQNTATATQTRNGVTSALSNTDTFTIDPAAPVINQTAESTNNAPTLTGTGEAGAVINLTIDGTQITAATTVAGDGTWRYTTGILPDGQNTAVATQTKNGVTSAASNVDTFVVDPTAPTVSGTHATTTALQDPMSPFAGVTVTDSNVVGGGSHATDAVTIALSGAAGTLSGAGLTTNSDGSYSLGAASPATLSSELGGLVFTPAIDNAGPLEITAFNLTVQSSSGTATTDANTSYTVDSRPNQSQFGTTTNSINNAQGEVYALYEGLLGRAPDQLGGEQAVSQLQGGVPLDQLTQSFLGSAEGSSYFTVGSSDGDFVNQLYERVLGRVDSYGEQAYWDSKLANGESRADVATAFVFSQEHTADLQPAFSAGVFVADNATSEAARLYYGVLDRSPDSAGLHDQAAALNRGLSLTSAAQNFLNSAEYAAHNPAPLSNQAFVNTLFENALGRAADQGGYWTQQLDNGAMSRAQVTVGIVEGGEAQKHLAGRIENGYHLA